MISHLSVKNYALIDSLDMSLQPGFSTITGETGAGKSILLGALSLILGKRADLKSLRDPERKCVIEGTFELEENRFLSFFEENDIDFDPQTLIRREITPSGKSRAFINDTPVRLDTLQYLAMHLIDVHSQHHNLLLVNRGFQLDLLDSFADNAEQRDTFYREYLKYKELLSERERLQQMAEAEKGDADYLQFLLDELDTAQLQHGEQEELEGKLERIQNSGTIQARLAEAVDTMDEERGSTALLNRMYQALISIQAYDPELEGLSQRVESLRIELEDIRQELEQKVGDTEYDPQEQEEMDARLSKIIALQKKHGVDSEQALIEKRQSLGESIAEMAQVEERLLHINESIERQSAKLKDASDRLSASRREVVKKLQAEIDSLLAELTMPHAQFVIEISPSDQYSESGGDNVSFLFSANKGQKPEVLSKVASGGELSRVMLALKSILARTKSLPSIIFDEIDTGVSGETAGKIGQIMAGMGAHMQVISITHLPQIAARGGHHYRVRKETKQGQTLTFIEELDEDERLRELARLLSGDKISEAAIANARSLLSV